jgi:hypothetical protein
MRVHAQDEPVTTGVNATGYVCIITSNKIMYQRGETPAITVEIKNNTDSTAYFVKVLHGSDDKRRFPYAYFTITKVGDASYKTKTYLHCGHLNAIKVADFVKVKSGDSFNPFEITGANGEKEIMYAWDNKLRDTANFSAPGKYIITFFYSGMENNFAKWSARYRDTMSYKDFLQMRALFFVHVPQINIVSNELLIEVTNQCFNDSKQF